MEAGLASSGSCDVCWPGRWVRVGVGACSAAWWCVDCDEIAWFVLSCGVTMGAEEAAVSMEDAGMAMDTSRWGKVGVVAFECGLWRRDVGREKIGDCIDAKVAIALDVEIVLCTVYL